MITINLRFLCLGILFILLFSACVDQSTTASNNTNVQSADFSNNSLVWLGSGEYLIVNQNWLYDINNKSFNRLGYIKPLVNKSTSTIDVASLPISNSFFRFDRADLVVVENIESKLSHQIVIPEWLADAVGGKSTNIKNLPVLFAENQLYVHQIDPETPTRYACGVYLLSKSSWQKLQKKACLESSFYHISRITALGNNIVATLSSAEGQQSLDFFAYNSLQTEQYQNKLIGTLDIAAVVPTQIQQDSNKNYTLIVPCVLENAKAKDCVLNTRKFWSVYKWFPETNKLQEQYSKLNHAVFAAPNSDQFAWFDQNKLCVGKPNDLNVVCTDLPKKI